MEIFIDNQIFVVIYSFFLGLIFGAEYDIIRIIHIICNIASYDGKERKINRGMGSFLIFFILDLVYSISVTALFSFFTYLVNSGRPRVFMLVSAFLGFVVYYFTLGRVVMIFSELIVGFIKKVLYYLIVVPFRFVLKVFARIVIFIYSLTVAHVVAVVRKLYLALVSDIYKSNIKRDISFEYKFPKEKIKK